MERRFNLSVHALPITAMDALMVQRCGLLVWQVLGGITRTRMSLMLLASVWVYSLIDIWAQGLAREKSQLPAPPMGTPSGELAEGADV